MDLLITVSNSDSAKIITPLIRACIRRSCQWELFLTHKGVQLLSDQNIVELIRGSDAQAIACHDSWDRYANEKQCPITLGSQTNHSEMIARANQVISL